MPSARHLSLHAPHLHHAVRVIKSPLEIALGPVLVVPSRRVRFWRLCVFKERRDSVRRIGREVVTHGHFFFCHDRLGECWAAGVVHVPLLLVKIQKLPGRPVLSPRAAHMRVLATWPRSKSESKMSNMCYACGGLLCCQSV